MKQKFMNLNYLRIYFTFRIMDHQDQWSEHIRFSYLCDFFEKSLCKKENKVNKEKKLEKLENFFSKCREICPKECDLFPVLRLLVPKLDQERGSYSIKETVFAKVHDDPNHLF